MRCTKASVVGRAEISHSASRPCCRRAVGELLAEQIGGHAGEELDRHAEPAERDRRVEHCAADIGREGRLCRPRSARQHVDQRLAAADDHLARPLRMNHALADDDIAIQARLAGRNDRMRGLDAIVEESPGSGTSAWPGARLSHTAIIARWIGSSASASPLTVARNSACGTKSSTGGTAGWRRRPRSPLAVGPHQPPAVRAPGNCRRRSRSRRHGRWREGRQQFGAEDRGIPISM